MFLRVVRARSGSEGREREYVRFVESYRDESGRPRQRVVANLGRKEVLAEHLDALIRIVRGEPDGGQHSGEVAEAQAWDWGPMLVARHLWTELGLDVSIQRLPMRSRRDAVQRSDRVLALVANRLCAPSSEHGLARWLETDFVCDRDGRRYVPQWRDDQERKRSKSPRVRVDPRQLQRWYRTLDALIAHKETIEKDLYCQLRTLFSLKLDLVLYDLTSTYFEGQGPPKATHGHSRDKRPRNRQVLVGMVMVDGWPLAHHVFEGNKKDETTVNSVITDLEQRFGLKRIIFVGDRGMVTVANLDRIKKEGHGYVIGLKRRRSQKAHQYIEQTTQGQWMPCPCGITASEKNPSPRTQVQEVADDEPGVRVFVVDSEERKAFERAQRLKAMQRTREALERLQGRVETGKLKDPAKVGAAAARALSRYHGYRYFDWEYKDGTFRFFDHPTNLPRECAYEGKYLIQTEELNLSPTEAVTIYKQLGDVERAFRELKDVIDLRPVFHQTDHRVDAHIFVAALAFLLHRALDKKLKAAQLDFSASEALRALRTVRVVDLHLADGSLRRIVTRGSPRAAQILRAVGIAHRSPPVPHPGNCTVL